MVRPWKFHDSDMKISCLWNGNDMKIPCLWHVNRIIISVTWKCMKSQCLCYETGQKIPCLWHWHGMKIPFYSMKKTRLRHENIMLMAWQLRENTMLISRKWHEKHAYGMKIQGFAIPINHVYVWEMAWNNHACCMKKLYLWHEKSMFIS